MSAEAQERSPTERINLVIHGSKGRLETDGPVTYLVKGVRNGVLAIWYTGVYCDHRIQGPNWFKKKVKTVCHSGDELVLGKDVWPTSYRAGRFL